ncbi:MAG: phage holin family protein [Elusimicrobiota bacterium]
MKILVHVLLGGLAVFVAARILPGVTVDGFGTAVVVAVVLGLINATLRPLLLLLTLPLNILTLGLFTFVIIGGLVLLAAAMVPGFHVASFWWALAFALTLSVLNAFLHGIERL